MRLAQDFKGALKCELQDVPLNSRHLSTDDYDRYFRDVHFIPTNTGPILVETGDPELTAEALRKYDTRLRKLGRRVFEREVEFQIADEEEPEADHRSPHEPAEQQK